MTNGPCSHHRIIRGGRMAGWISDLGSRTLICLDCGMFWLWHSDGNFFAASGMGGSKLWTRIQKRNKRIEFILKRISEQRSKR